jgi:UDP-N-acetylglucosamine 2-epimerase (non-hydrolysing)
MSGIDPDRVLSAVEVVTARPKGYTALPPDYDLRDVSQKVLQIVLSYVDYVNRTVWGKR